MEFAIFLGMSLGGIALFAAGYHLGSKDRPVPKYSEYDFTELEKLSNDELAGIVLGNQPDERTWMAIIVLGRRSHDVKKKLRIKAPGFFETH